MVSEPHSGAPAAAVFDLDGVVTRTARLHARAWMELFDDYLRARALRSAVDLSTERNRSEPVPIPLRGKRYELAPGAVLELASRN